MILGYKNLQIIIHFSKNGKTKLPGFSNETFFAITQILDVIPKLVIDLLCKSNYSFVLTEKFQSDPIERRFSRYRQYHGGSYYISVRQIFDAEKKIKISTLLKHANFNLRSLSELSSPDADSANESPDLLLSHISEDFDFSKINSVTKNLAAFIGGFVANFICKNIKCTYCLNSLHHDTQSFDLDILDCPSNEIFELINIRNRGGLKYPSNFTLFYTLCAFCVYDAFSFIMPLLQSFKNPALQLSRATFMIICISDNLTSIISTLSACETHDNLPISILYHVFSCLLKDYVKTQNQNLKFNKRKDNEQKRDSSLRKSLKLSSEC